MADGPYQKTYSHDPAGNIASLTDIGNTVLSYSYDSSGRLTGATDTAAGSFGSLAWTYDTNGNRQSETRNAGTMPYVYSPPNWLYQKGADTRSKTPSGNTASISGLASFTYDGYNRLATSQTAAETTTYTYNALGQRIKKINQNGLSTVFHYGPDGELLYERDANGNTKAYVWLDGRPLARIDNDAQIYYYHIDHLGTPQAMTNQSGATVWKADYEPFGKATIRINTIENNLRLPGQYYDRETGLHYNYFRDYEPGSGRYIEADPIGLEGGLNLYSYVDGNPVSGIDPMGLQSVVTDMQAGTTTFDPAPYPGTPVTIPTRNDVASTAQPGATGPYTTRIPVGCPPEHRVEPMDPMGRTSIPGTEEGVTFMAEEADYLTHMRRDRGGLQQWGVLVDKTTMLGGLAKPSPISSVAILVCRFLTHVGKK